MEQQPKILVNAKADQSLETMLAEVNDGFQSGRVKKMQLASWIILHFHQKLFRKQIESIRSDHFDQIAHLKAVVRRMEEAKRTDGNLELGELLQPLKTSGAKRRKRTQAITHE